MRLVVHTPRTQIALRSHRSHRYTTRLPVQICTQIRPKMPGRQTSHMTASSPPALVSSTYPSKTSHASCPSLSCLMSGALHSSTSQLNHSAFGGIRGAFRGCLGGVRGYQGFQGVCGVYFVTETVQVELRSGRVSAPASHPPYTDRCNDSPSFPLPSPPARPADAAST